MRPRPTSRGLRIDERPGARIRVRPHPRYVRNDPNRLDRKIVIVRAGIDASAPRRRVPSVRAKRHPRLGLAAARDRVSRRRDGRARHAALLVCAGDDRPVDARRLAHRRVGRSRLARGDALGFAAERRSAQAGGGASAISRRAYGGSARPSWSRRTSSRGPCLWASWDCRPCWRSFPRSASRWPG